MEKFDLVEVHLADSLAAKVNVHLAANVLDVLHLADDHTDTVDIHHRVDVLHLADDHTDAVDVPHTPVKYSKF